MPHRSRQSLCRAPSALSQGLALLLSLALVAVPVSGYAEISGDLPPLAEPVPEANGAQPAAQPVQGGDGPQALQDAVADAEVDVNGGTWFVLGCVLNVYGVLAAWFTDPSPPYARLMGKPEPYVRSYLPAYRAEASSLRQRYALYGCLASVGAMLVYSTVVVSLTSSPNGGE